MPVVLLLAALAIDPRLEAALGPTVVDVVSEAADIEAFRLGDATPSGARAGGFAIVTTRRLPPDAVSRLRSFVLDSHLYELPPIRVRKDAEPLESAKLCTFRPDLAFRVTGPRGTADVLLSLACDDLAAQVVDVRRRRGLDLPESLSTASIAPGRNRWLRFAKSLFPDDEGLAAMSAKPVLAPVLDRLREADTVSVFRVLRGLDERRAFERWRGLAPARHAANLYEVWGEKTVLSPELRRAAIDLFSKRALHAGPPAAGCTQPAGYAVRFEFERTPVKQESLDVLVGIECGVVELGWLRTEFEGWRSSRRIITSRVGDLRSVLAFLRDAMPSAGELETAVEPEGAPVVDVEE